MKTEDLKKAVYDIMGDRSIIAEITGEADLKTAYIALTEDIVYVAFGKYIQQFPLNIIRSVELSKKLLGSSMHIVITNEEGRTFWSGLFGRPQINQIIFPNNEFSKFQKFVNLIDEQRSKLKGKGMQQPSIATVATSVETIPQKIQQLAQLKESGILTQQEFEDKKKELLSRM